MKDNSIQTRTFSLHLPSHYVHYYRVYIHWFRYLLERLGKKEAFKVWNRAFRNKEDDLLEQILSSGWLALNGEEDTVSGRPLRTQLDAVEKKNAQLLDVPGELNKRLEEYFQSEIEGVSIERARKVMQETTPFLQIGRLIHDLYVTRDTTAYEAIHLFHHGIACLAETLIDLHGKRGELIAYDAILADIASQKSNQMSVDEFMAKRLATFRNVDQVDDLFTAALTRKIVHISRQEINWTVKECEFSRYFLERHPRVGYLIACSSDNALYQSFNPHIRLQLSSSLMEGCELCRYKIYAIEGMSA
jgi:hypothetical protein